MDEQNQDKKAFAIEEFERRLDARTALLRSRLRKEDALKHINHHRHGTPGTMKSIWLDRELIDFISQAANTSNISGIRIYFAKYKGGVHPVPENPNIENKPTVIVAPTTVGFAAESDVDLAYFNYGRPCPPSCNGDEGQP